MIGSKRTWHSAFVGYAPAAPVEPTSDAQTFCTSRGPLASENIETVCYGMICDVKADFIPDFRISDACVETIASGVRNYHPLKICFRRNCMLQSTKGVDIAVLNSGFSTALRMLAEIVQCDSFVTTDEWYLKVQHYRKTGKALMSIEVYFYGPSYATKDVGKTLSKTGMFLQHPTILRNLVRYENPHYLKISASKQSETNILTPFSGSIEETSNDLISSVLDDLDQQTHLDNAHVDQSSILTPLKSHQKEGVDFIARREARVTLQPFSLWRPHTDRSQRLCYQHLIFGCRRAQLPDEDFGGIIADEMGLGKTLTMLAAIFTSKGRGEKPIYPATPVYSPVSLRRETQATLVIVPSALIMENWTTESRKHFAQGSLKCSEYYGKDRDKDLDASFESDVVLTTYATLTSDYRRGKTALLDTYWFRIVLDEAHSIRHQHTKQFRAVAALSAQHRWCLTGTPIQNQLDDLGALIRFLQIPLLDKPSTFHSNISRPIEQGNTTGARHLRSLLQAICLRRTKDRLRLPEPEEILEDVKLTEEEKIQYCQIGESFRQSIDDAVSGLNRSKAYNGLFQAILRLRISCNHGTLVPLSSPASNPISPITDEFFSLLQQNDEAICENCSCDIISIGESNVPQSGNFASCSHLLCQGCVDQSKQGGNRSGKIHCPVCQIVCSMKRPKGSQDHQEQLVCQVQSGRSSKLEALIRNVISHPVDKSIVFSCWKKTIHLAASYLALKDINVSIVDGSMSLPERQAALDQFRGDPQIPVLLMTLGTGAVGLNLTVASRIHILEPQWNPLLESQAIGRAIRLGQKKQVTVVRYIARDTVEQYIRSRQSKKLYLARLGWDAESNESEEDKSRKLDELKSLLTLQEASESSSDLRYGSEDIAMKDPA